MTVFATTLTTLLASGFSLVQPGTFHGGEVQARDGERWMALRVSGSGAMLAETRLQVRVVEDPMVDAPGAKTGREVASSEADGVLSYLRGSTLRAGPIDMAVVEPNDSAMAHLEPQRFTFQGKAYRIETHCDMAAVEVMDGQKQYPCRTVLHAPGATQFLKSRIGYFEFGSDVMAFSDDGQSQLLFAGDLDRDGRVDLLFDMSTHYNVSRPTLFLSTRAAEGALVGKAAEFESVGC